MRAGLWIGVFPWGSAVMWMRPVYGCDGSHAALFGARVSGIDRPLMRKYLAVLFVTSKARLRSTAACQSGSTCETSSRNSLLNVLDTSLFACFGAPAGRTTRAP